MRVLVTGQQGQVVSSLRQSALAGRGIDVVTLGRPELDLAQPGDWTSLFAQHRPDVIVNAAAYTAVDQAESEPELALAINGTGAGAVAQAAKSLGVPIIHISTDYVFPGDKLGPYREDDPTGPTSVYGRSKLAGEHAVAANQPDHAILRTAWVYAAMGKNFVRTMLKLAETRDEVSVVADQHGSPTFADDLAEAILHAARNLVTAPGNADFLGVFHVSGKGETDWASFAEEIFSISRAEGGPAASVKRITTAQYPTPARRPANSRLDCTLFSSRHGFEMPLWQDSLRRCVLTLIRQGKMQA